LFGTASRRLFFHVATPEGRAVYRQIVAEYGAIVGLGLASFVLNRRRFAPGRFLIYATAAVLWAVLMRLGGVFAVVWAATLALNWRASPDRRPFIDTRRHLFPRALRGRWDDLRRALRDGDRARWRSLLDPNGVSAVMVRVESTPRLFQALGRDPDWVEFYDDG